MNQLHLSESSSTPRLKTLFFLFIIVTFAPLGNVLLGLTSDSHLLVFKPSKKEYEEVANYKVADSATWAAPIIAGNRIFVKDRDSITLWTLEK